MNVYFACWLIFSLFTEFSSSLSKSAVVFAENVAEDAKNRSNDSVSEYSLDSGSALSNFSEYNDTEKNFSVKSDSELNEIRHEGENTAPPNEFVFAEAVSQNSGVVNSITEERGAVFTLADAAIELEKRATNIPKQTTSQNETPMNEAKNITNDKQITLNDSEITKTNIEKDIKDSSEEKVSENNITEKTEKLVVEAGPKEEIPSFSEWTQKQLEEAEKKKEQVNSSTQGSQTNGKSIKKRSKNYASPDCGAKIVAANPEAISPGSVLSSSRDEYKLNICTSRIWFVVELCEAIQAKKIDLANFELFSSSPKDFSIYVSDRFPTRDWSNVGHFTAKDERDIQTFDLHPHLFGKYIKFEMHSHHGSEHYCPISLFRVYGTSEFEVLQTEDQPHSNHLYDDDDDETLDFAKEDVPRNLLSSATDAVISIVKKAAEVLGNKGDASNQTADLKANADFKFLNGNQTCSTPTHLLVCDNCSDSFYASVYDLLSCQSRFLHILVNNTNLRDALHNSDVCSGYGLKFSKNNNITNTNYSFLLFFPPKYVAALCNTLAVLENKVVRNSTIHCFNCTEDLLNGEPNKILDEKMPKNIEGDFLPNILEETDNTPQLLKVSEEKKGINDTANDNQTEIVQDKEEEAVILDSNGSQKDVSKSEVKIKKGSTGNESSPEIDTTSQENLEESLENFASDGNENQTAAAATTTATIITTTTPSVVTPAVVPQAQNKESVFVRLTNRIKALERNMSLSSQYLEELSKRYKKQVEEMQRLLDKTITTLNEENKKKEERTQKLEEQLSNLTMAIESLTAERNMWMAFLYWLLLVVVVFATFWFFCRRKPSAKQPTSRIREKSVEVQRRKSDDILMKKSTSKKRRRPSEEAINIEAHNYQHLLVDESDICFKKKEKKRRKKKPNLIRSKSITAFTKESVNEDHKYRTIHTDINFPFMTSNDTSLGHKRKVSAPAKYEQEDIPNKIQDMPIVLDESEHTSVDPLVFNGFEEDPGHKESNVKLEPKPGESRSFLEPVRSVTDIKNDVNSVANGKGYLYRKSASVDDTTNKKKVFINDTNSLSGSDEKFTINKKDKKGALKKIFRSFSFKHKVEEIQNY